MAPLPEEEHEIERRQVAGAPALSPSPSDLESIAIDTTASVEEGGVVVDDEESTTKKDGGESRTARQDSSELSSRSASPAAGSSSGKLFDLFTGMRNDLKARLPYYLDDWGCPQSLFTVLNATVFAFVIQLIPALIFAELMSRETQGNLSTAEVLLSSAIIGIIYAVFSGQPLVIMGITGPVALLLGTSYGLTETFEAEYFPFFFWTMIWAGLMHVVSAMVGLVSLVWTVTPFTTQIFELFIAVTFIYSSLRDLIEPLSLGNGDQQADRSAQYAQLLIGVVTMYVAWTLHFAETWVSFTRQVRVTLSAYNTLLAVVVGTAISYIPGIRQENNGVGGLERVDVQAPWDWQPTADRSWMVDPLSGIDARGIFGAIVPGFMFFLLFIIDHNVSSILTQSPHFNLKKPCAYHWDFFVLGITFIPCALLGLPPGNGLIPQAPLHARALCKREYKEDEYGVKHEVVTHCEEQRWSGLGQALLMFVALAAFAVIGLIPRGCLFGLFLYLGMGALHGNEIWERFLMFFILPKRRPQIPVVRNVEWRTVQIWTLVQGGLAIAVFAVAQFASVGYLYPLLLTILVPFRSYVLGRFFEDKDLKYLDPFGDDQHDEDYVEEQRLIRKNHAEHEEESDDENIVIPCRAQFRGEVPKQEIQ